MNGGNKNLNDNFINENNFIFKKKDSDMFVKHTKDKKDNNEQLHYIVRENEDDYRITIRKIYKDKKDKDKDLAKIEINKENNWIETKFIQNYNKNSKIFNNEHIIKIAVKEEEDVKKKKEKIGTLYQEIKEKFKKNGLEKLIDLKDKAVANENATKKDKEIFKTEFLESIKCTDKEPDGLEGKIRKTYEAIKDYCKKKEGIITFVEQKDNDQDTVEESYFDDGKCVCLRKKERKNSEQVCGKNRYITITEKYWHNDGSLKEKIIKYDDGEEKVELYYLDGKKIEDKIQYITEPTTIMSASDIEGDIRFYILFFIHCGAIDIEKIPEDVRKLLCIYEDWEDHKLKISPYLISLVQQYLTTFNEYKKKLNNNEDISKLKDNLNAIKNNIDGILKPLSKYTQEDFEALFGLKDKISGIVKKVDPNLIMLLNGDILSFRPFKKNLVAYKGALYEEHYNVDLSNSGIYIKVFQEGVCGKSKEEQEDKIGKYLDNIVRTYQLTLELLKSVGDKNLKNLVMILGNHDDTLYYDQIQIADGSEGIGEKLQEKIDNARKDIKEIKKEIAEMARYSRLYQVRNNGNNKDNKKEKDIQILYSHTSNAINAGKDDQLLAYFLEKQGECFSNVKYHKGCTTKEGIEYNKKKFGYDICLDDAYKEFLFQYYTYAANFEPQIRKLVYWCDKFKEEAYKTLKDKNRYIIDAHRHQLWKDLQNNEFDISKERILNLDSDIHKTDLPIFLKSVINPKYEKVEHIYLDLITGKNVFSQGVWQGVEGRNIEQFEQFEKVKTTYKEYGEINKPLKRNSSINFGFKNNQNENKIYKAKSVIIKNNRQKINIKEGVEIKLKDWKEKRKKIEKEQKEEKKENSIEESKEIVSLKNKIIQECCKTDEEERKLKEEEARRLKEEAEQKQKEEEEKKRKQLEEENKKKLEEEKLKQKELEEKKRIEEENKLKEKENKEKQNNLKCPEETVLFGNNIIKECYNPNKKIKEDLKKDDEEKQKLEEEKQKKLKEERRIKEETEQKQKEDEKVKRLDEENKKISSIIDFINGKNDKNIDKSYDSYILKKALCRYIMEVDFNEPNEEGKDIYNRGNTLTRLFDRQKDKNNEIYKIIEDFIDAKIMDENKKPIRYRLRGNFKNYDKNLESIYFSAFQKIYNKSGTELLDFLDNIKKFHQQQNTVCC